MFSNSFKTDIKLGEKYRDGQTGIEGTATAVTFYQYGCERVNIETVLNGKIEEYGFDAPRLTHVSTGERAESPRVGGPDKAPGTRRPGAVAR